MKVKSIKKAISFIGITFIILLSPSSFGEIKPYEITENTGLNKLERIDAMDSYLATLSLSLKSMESKLDDNALKIKNLESLVKSIKEELSKNSDAALKESLTKSTNKKSTEKTAGEKDLSEVDKLKADILSLKNQDIEKLKIMVEDLSDTVKALQATVRNQIK